MATSATQAAELLREMLNISNANAVTLKWSEFYEGRFQKPTATVNV